MSLNSLSMSSASKASKKDKSALHKRKSKQDEENKQQLIDEEEDEIVHEGVERRESVSQDDEEDVDTSQEEMKGMLQTILTRLAALEKSTKARSTPKAPKAQRPTSSGVSVSDFLDAGGVREMEDEDEVPASSAAAPPTVRPHPLHERLAPQVVQDIGSGGFREWMRTEVVEWRNSRNKNECAVLADALDALLRGDEEEATEILVRRFVGVVNADKSGNWNYASVLASDMPRRTLLRPQVMSAVLREAKNLSILESGGAARPFRRDRDHAGDRSGNDRRSQSSAPTSVGYPRGRGGRGGGTRPASSGDTAAYPSSSAAAAPGPHTHSSSAMGSGGHGR
jgi:hypothetical protein